MAAVARPAPPFTPELMAQLREIDAMPRGEDSYHRWAETIERHERDLRRRR